MESVQIAIQQRLSLMLTRNPFIAEGSSHATWRICITHDDHWLLKQEIAFVNFTLCHYSGNCWSHTLVAWKWSFSQW